MQSWARRLPILMPVLISLLTFASSTHATIVGPWNPVDPGTSTIGVESKRTALTYALDPADSEIDTWNATANVLESELYQLDWNNSGSHRITQVTAFPNPVHPAGTLFDEGPVDCCIPPSVGFSISPTDSFFATSSEPIGFSLGGPNDSFDTTPIGSLEITTVPLPPAIWMLLLALGLTAFIAHRGKQHIG